jgi:hypothetical protein
MHHVASHTAQRKPCKVEAEELDFLEYIRPPLKVPIICLTISSTWIRCLSTMQC